MSQRNDFNMSAEFEKIQAALSDLLAKVLIFCKNDKTNDTYNTFFGLIVGINATLQKIQTEDEPTTDMYIRYNQVNHRKKLLEASIAKHFPLLKQTIELFKMADRTQEEMKSEAFQDAIKACDNSVTSIDSIIPDLNNLAEACKAEEKKIKAKKFSEDTAPKNN